MASDMGQKRLRKAQPPGFVVANLHTHRNVHIRRPMTTIGSTGGLSNDTTGEERQHEPPTTVFSKDTMKDTRGEDSLQPPTTTSVLTTSTVTSASIVSSGMNDVRATNIERMKLLWPEFSMRDLDRTDEQGCSSRAVLCACAVLRACVRVGTRAHACVGVRVCVRLRV